LTEPYDFTYNEHRRALDLYFAGGNCGQRALDDLFALHTAPHHEGDRFIGSPPGADQ
jgi:hypothetical protein